METTIKSERMGVFSYNETSKSFEIYKEKINWQLEISSDSIDVNEMVKEAEKLFNSLEEFDQKARIAISENLITFKNDFWPEYDENDINLNWDEVESGKYDVTKNEFANRITLYHIRIRTKEIYCEYGDGDLFGGHLIHAYFNNDYELVKVNV